MSDKIISPSSAAHSGGLETKPGKIQSLATRSGFEFNVRSVEPSDETALAGFFDNVTSDDIRFRFLSPVKKVGDAMLKQLVDVDHDGTEDYLAFAEGSDKIIASAEIAGDAKKETAEVAIVIHQDYKGRGMGWTLLEYVVQQAKHKGFKKLQSIESRQNHQVIELEREMGFRASSFPGDASLILLEIDLV